MQEGLGKDKKKVWGGFEGDESKTIKVCWKINNKKRGKKGRGLGMSHLSNCAGCRPSNDASSELFSLVAWGVRFPEDQVSVKDLAVQIPEF